MKLHFWKWMFMLLAIFALPVSAQDAPTAEAIPDQLGNLPSRINLNYLIYLPPEWIFIENLGTITFFEGVEGISTVQSGMFAVPTFILLTSPYPINFQDTPRQALESIAVVFTESGDLARGEVIETERGGHQVVETLYSDDEVEMVLGALEIDGDPMVYVIGTAPGDAGGVETIEGMLASVTSYDQWIEAQNPDSEELAQWLYLGNASGALQIAAPASWSVRDVGGSVRIPALLPNISVARQVSRGMDLPEDAVALTLNPPRPMLINGERIDPAEMTLGETLLRYEYLLEGEPPSGAEAVALEADFPAFALVLDGATIAVIGDIDGQLFIMRQAVRGTPLDQATVNAILEILPTARVSWDV